MVTRTFGARAWDVEDWLLLVGGSFSASAVCHRLANQKLTLFSFAHRPLHLHTKAIVFEATTLLGHVACRSIYALKIFFFSRNNEGATLREPSLSCTVTAVKFPEQQSWVREANGKEQISSFYWFIRSEGSFDN